MLQTIQPIPSSYRDPSGFMFRKNDRLYRQVNQVFKNDFDIFIQSGCYDKLVKNEWLISHTEINENLTGSIEWYKTLEPDRIPFISYPYEWCFDQLKDAALLTLTVLKQSLPFGLILKDATPYNVQWKNGKPVFIDTLSFEKYDASKPWIAYRQFCECFLSPLLLMHYKGVPLHMLQLAYPEGIPLQITSALLPWRSRFSVHAYLHIHLHAKMKGKQSAGSSNKVAAFDETKLRRLIDSLEMLITSLQWKSESSTWEHYYEEAATRDQYLEEKKKIITEWTKEMQGLKLVADIGGNDGEFSRIIAYRQILTITADADHNAINNLYRATKELKLNALLPLVLDFGHPGPAIGVNNRERDSFIDRLDADLVMALALVHHLAIGRNIPFDKIADFFAATGKKLLIEFVPKDDPKSQVLLSQKKDIYAHYSEEEFVKAFESRFSLIKRQAIGNTGRVLYLFTKHE